MLLTFNVSAAGEFVQYIATGGREPMLAHEIVESQNLPRKPPRGKACQPLRNGLEAPQAIEFECCQDLFSVSPGEQRLIIVHRTSRTYNHPIPPAQVQPRCTGACQLRTSLQSAGGWLGSERHA